MSDDRTQDPTYRVIKYHGPRPWVGARDILRGKEIEVVTVEADPESGPTSYLMGIVDV